MHYAYVFLDPRTRTPFYVGQGRRSSARVRRHLQRGTHAKDVHGRIDEIRAAGHEPTVLTADVVSSCESLDLERLLISELGRVDIGDGPLLNRTSGGQGSGGRVGFKQSPETRAKIAASTRGKKRSDATRLRLKAAWDRRVASGEGEKTFAKMQAARWPGV